MLVAGIDEVGRGCIAGPVVAACVWIDEEKCRELGVGDSKKISAAKRFRLCQAICQHARSWGVGMASVEEVDSINILQATWKAMQRAYASCWLKPDELWVDGRDNPFKEIKVHTVIGGDGSVPAIGAASIVAKVYRDTLMEVFDRQYPGYGFAGHKGYGTKAHLQSISTQGVCGIHRKSFEPIRTMVQGIEA